jgi:hypothetical protein
VIARVVENWLGSAGERAGYEIPFCQALFAQGHRILFRSSHGQLEQGKDVITVDPRGGYHAYQLKAGDLTLPAWREIRGEVEELVGLPLQHPDIPDGAPFTAYLVVSGVLKDPARKTIKDWKQEWERQGRRPLELLDRDALLRLFLDTHGDTLISAPADFERFLRLYLADKKDILDRREFATFVESSLPLDSELKRTDLRRALASTAALASYVLHGYARERNHYAVAEGWLIVAAYLMAMMERYPVYFQACRPSLDLCLTAWESAAESLTSEALDSPRWIEGDFIPDYTARGWRTTLLLGHLCSFALYRRAKQMPLADEGGILGRVLQELQHALFWGESAGPHCYSIILFLWLHGQEELACHWAGSLARTIAEVNGDRSGGIGIPDVYVQPDSLLKMIHLGETPFAPRETFRGRSFLLPILVEFLTRRGRKRLLTRLWHDLCEVDRAEFALDRKLDFYRWHAKTGSLDTRRWSHPQRWTDLVAKSNEPAPQDMVLTREFVPLLMPFFLVYPHRFTSRMAHLIESSV